MVFGNLVREIYCVRKNYSMLCCDEDAQIAWTNMQSPLYRPNGIRGIALYCIFVYFIRCQLSRLYSKEFLKKSVQLLNNPLFFLRAVFAAEAGHRRHQLINVLSRCLNLSVTEDVFDIFSGFVLLQIFFGNNGCKLFFLLLHHVLMPFDNNVVCVVCT